ncbi:hypothetical protein K461DRAFT_291337 [Myriangium duriaei CBS 260.36]|uniref:Uncharacterized protein n=1 Tax=Myriangium duriaei CBS 260.36 TaxID=1168546 RepID=A0A9P4J7D0_9PEZI|nr:hypothetical protein K461DRAFT_291337 [Myriangium duriaei CBS 260.36]
MTTTNSAMGDTTPTTNGTTMDSSSSGRITLRALFQTIYPFRARLLELLDPMDLVRLRPALSIQYSASERKHFLRPWQFLFPSLSFPQPTDQTPEVTSSTEVSPSAEAPDFSTWTDFALVVFGPGLSVLESRHKGATSRDLRHAMSMATLHVLVVPCSGVPYYDDSCRAAVRAVASAFRVTDEEREDFSGDRSGDLWVRSVTHKVEAHIVAQGSVEGEKLWLDGGGRVLAFTKRFGRGMEAPGEEYLGTIKTMCLLPEATEIRERFVLWHQDRKGLDGEDRDGFEVRGCFADS